MSKLLLSSAKDMGNAVSKAQNPAQLLQEDITTDELDIPPEPIAYRCGGSLDTLM